MHTQSSLLNYHWLQQVVLGLVTAMGVMILFLLLGVIRADFLTELLLSGGNLMGLPIIFTQTLAEPSQHFITASFTLI